MKRDRIGWGVALLAAATLAFAQGADKPVYKVGDKWVFKQSDGSANSTEWSREITAVATGALTVRFENGTTNEFDEMMNFTQGGVQNVRLLVRYPLKVGDSWSFVRKAGQNGQGEERGEAKVVKIESITVPAGTFECYRIDAKAQFTLRTYNEQREWARWYCPTVKWIVREDLETNTFRPGAGGQSRTKATSELVSFTPGP